MRGQDTFSYLPKVIMANCPEGGEEARQGQDEGHMVSRSLGGRGA